MFSERDTLSILDYIDMAVILHGNDLRLCARRVWRCEDMIQGRSKLQSI